MVSTCGNWVRQQVSEYDGGKEFLYFNNADAILFRARMAAAMLSVAAACLVFVAADEMCGTVPALLALLLFVFEPNMIAHGSLVTTDMGMALFLFATVVRLLRVCEEAVMVAACRYGYGRGWR